MRADTGNLDHLNIMALMLVLVVALLFAGSRPLWEPDESRYTTVAMVMLQTGDYLHPARHPDVPHWTKPPLTYWTIAMGLKVFGSEEWAARLPSILGFLMTMVAVFYMGKALRLKQPGLPVLVMSAMPLVIGGSNYISTDMLLTGFVSLGWLFFIRSWIRPGRNGHGNILLMWFFFALAFLTKGPPALLFLLPILIGSRFSPMPHQTLYWHRGLSIFLVFGLGWYLWVIIEDPQLLSYFLWEETVLRSMSDHSGRSAEWYGAFKIYIPTIVLGTLPWLIPLIGGFRAHWKEKQSDPTSRLLLWWLLLPLAVFFLSRSRMPFYLLPLTVPAALMISRYLDRKPVSRWLLAITATWVIVLCSLRAHHWFDSQPKNPATLARQIEAHCSISPDEVLFFEMHPMMGLTFYMNTQTKLVQFGTLADELISRPAVQARLWLVREDISPQFEKKSVENGVSMERIVTIQHHRRYQLYQEADTKACGS